MYRVLKKEEALNLLSYSKTSSIFMLVGKDNAFYVTYDKHGKKAEERIWYRLSLNPFEENSYRLVELEEPIVDNSVGLYTSIASWANFGEDNALMNRNLVLIEMLYLKQNGVQLSTKEVAALMNLTTSRVHQLKNIMTFLYRKILKEILEPIDEDYSFGNLEEYYRGWISMISKINEEFTITDKVRLRIISFLVRNKLTKLSLFKKYIESNPLKNITNEIRVYKNVSSAVNNYDRVVQLLKDIYNLNQNNQDPLGFYQ